MTNFQIIDPSLEYQWRAIILSGKNSATYKFAFAKALLEVVEKQKTRISLEKLEIHLPNVIIDYYTRLFLKV